MGAYEGAGITVLGKGVRYPAGSDAFGTGAEAAFPDGTVASAEQQSAIAVTSQGTSCITRHASTVLRSLTARKAVAAFSRTAGTTI